MAFSSGSFFFVVVVSRFFFLLLCLQIETLIVQQYLFFFFLETGKRGRIKVQSSSSALDSIFSSSCTVGVHLIRAARNVTAECQFSEMGWVFSAF